MQVDFVHNVIFIVVRQHTDVAPTTASAKSRINLPVSEAFVIDDDADLFQRLSLRLMHRHAVG
jgi:hypothetical protein